jgi:hypothetical protein
MPETTSEEKKGGSWLTSINDFTHDIAGIFQPDDIGFAQCHQIRQVIVSQCPMHHVNGLVATSWLSDNF